MPAMVELARRMGASVPVPNDRTGLALFGVWNAGKSTLLKRLLVETGRPIPDWLTIAASPETNFVGETDILEDVVALDTPGISAGMSLHEGEAAAALRR